MQIQHRSIAISIATAILLIGCTKNGDSTNTAAAAPHEPAVTPDTRDIAGIELGKEIVIPECKKENFHGSILYASEGAEHPCFEHFSGAGNTLATAKNLPKGPDHNGVHSGIQLGSAAVPQGVSSTVRLLMLDGVPEQITLDTDGVEVQERLYSLLIAKYGAPASSNISQLQNAMGARYQGIEATWNLPGMSILFLGMANRPNEGLIVATTQKGNSFLRDRQPKSASGF